jgi:uncharacterized protein (TIGR03067 family)
MRAALFLAALLVAAVGAGAAEPTVAPPPRTAAEAARAKLFGWWEAVEVVRAGETNPAGHTWEGWKLTPTEVRTVTIHGQVETTTFRNGLRVDTTKTPWRLDFVNDEEVATRGKRCVCTGIFRFEGGRLVWVTEGACRSVNPGVEPAADDPHRPKDFTSTRENGQTRTVFKRVTGLWYTD